MNMNFPDEQLRQTADLERFNLTRCAGGTA